MDFEFKKAIVHSIIRVVIDLPFALLVIRAWVWGGLFDRFKLPPPSWKQTWGIALLILTIA